MTINLPCERYASDERVEYTAGSAVTAGTPIQLDTGLVGIPANDIAAGDTDELDITGRFRAWGIAAQAWIDGDQIGWDANGDPYNGTTGSGAFTNVEANWDFPVGTCVKAKATTEEMGVILLNQFGQGSSPYVPVGAQQSLVAGGGAVNVTSYYTAGASDAGGDAWTLADGLRVGQLKRIQLITDGGGDAVLTPVTLVGGTTITFADAGDTALLMWTPSGWVPLQLSNDADGATAPVLA